MHSFVISLLGFYRTTFLAAAMLFCLVQSASAQATKTINNVFITWYGFNDNSCIVETEYSCNTIAYPMKYGFPTKHDIATEDKGTYENPITHPLTHKLKPRIANSA